MATNNDQRSAAGSGVKTSRQARARKNKATKIIIFVVELAIIVVMLGVLYIVTRVTKGGSSSGGNGKQDESIKIEVLDQDKLYIPTEVKENESMKGYMNVALFGVDISNEKYENGIPVDLLPAGTLRDSGLLKGFRSDTIMIASVNLDTKEIKLVSLFRDTVVHIGSGDGSWEKSYTKCNAAYQNGGAEQAVKMLNSNLDMDIKDFVTVSYWALVEVIDALGGVYIDVAKEELVHLNNYGLSIGKTMNVDYQPLASSGYQLLNGMQATAYCRIRYIGDDYARTKRQRTVIKAIETQAKKSDLNSLLKAFEGAQRDIYTSLQPEDIITLISQIAGYKIVDEEGFPLQEIRSAKNMGAKGACIVPEDLEANVKWLHKFLFDEEDYSVTTTVKEFSNVIKSNSAVYQ